MLAFRFPLGSMVSVDCGGACTGSEEMAEKLPMKMKHGLVNVNGRLSSEGGGREIGDLEGRRAVRRPGMRERQRKP